MTHSEEYVDALYSALRSRDVKLTYTELEDSLREAAAAQLEDMQDREVLLSAIDTVLSMGLAPNAHAILESAIRRCGGEAQPPHVHTPACDPTFTREDALKAAEKTFKPKLDPYPWIVWKGHGGATYRSATAPHDLVKFDPREGYSQDREDYS